MSEQPNIYKIYKIIAKLKLNSPLLIADGENDGVIDKHILKNKKGEPFIPGTSLAGALRNLAIRKNKEIAELLVYTHSYMREYISKNLSEYKIEHKKNRVIKKEMIRAVDNMNNSYISNSAILEWNRQSYDYNENGNIVFNEKHGARPLDLPKTFYNTI